MARSRKPAKRPARKSSPNPVQYEDVLDRFLASRDSANTRAQYRRVVHDFFERVGLTDVTAVDGDTIIRYNEALEAARADHDAGDGGLAPDTIRARIYALRSFLRFCYAYGLTPHLPPERVAEFLTLPGRRELTQKDILDRDEADRILEAALTRPRDHCIVLLFLQSGLRVSELAALRRGDIYESGGRWWLQVNRGKGDKQREVEIPQSAYEAVAAYRDEVAGDAGETDPLFPSREGGFLSRAHLYRIVRASALRAGIGRVIGPHNLRHTYANQQRMLGERIEVLALQLGHAQIETTRRYTQPAILRDRTPVRDWMAETDEPQPTEEQP